MKTQSSSTGRRRLRVKYFSSNFILESILKKKLKIDDYVMSAVAAAVNKKGKNVVPTVVAMLKKLTHRGTDAHGVAAHTLVKITSSLEELENINLNSSVAIGYNLSRVTKRDEPQPILGKDYALAFHGRFFHPHMQLPLEEAMKRLQNNPERNAELLLKELDGSFVFILSVSDKIIAGRDPFGTIPLYYGENEILCGLATERKALWNLGIKTVNSFSPGSIAKINAQGFTFEKAASIVQPQTKPIDMEAAARHLRNLLLKATVERVKDIKKVAVAFSGGIDSAVVAHLAKMSKVDVQLISVGLENQQELKHTEEASKALGLPIHVQTYNSEDVKRIVAKVLWLIEEPDPMKVGVAVPFFWTAEVAAKMGRRVLLAGQGGDELFGGYQRYLAEFDQKASEALQKTLYHDVLSSYETNFQRDNTVCAFHKVELRLPFINREVVNFALSLPIQLKIESASDPLRKRVLREMAKDLGIPEFIVEHPKKAVQYATGVHKALKKLAKSKGLILSDYLKQLFLELYPEQEGSP